MTNKTPDFIDGFSAALQGAEAIIWAMEDDAFLYDTVSDAMQAVIGELQDMERRWTGRVSMVHRSELLTKIEAQAAEIERLREALDLLGVALVGHGHTWSPEERTAYDRAVRIINKADKS